MVAHDFALKLPESIIPSDETEKDFGLNVPFVSRFVAILCVIYNFSCKMDIHCILQWRRKVHSLFIAEWRRKVYNREKVGNSALKRDLVKQVFTVNYIGAAASTSPQLRQVLPVRYQMFQKQMTRGVQ